jgi:hypothetical protein
MNDETQGTLSEVVMRIGPGTKTEFVICDTVEVGDSGLTCHFVNRGESALTVGLHNLVYFKPVVVEEP